MKKKINTNGDNYHIGDYYVAETTVYLFLKLISSTLILSLANFRTLEGAAITNYGYTSYFLVNIFTLESYNIGKNYRFSLRLNESRQSTTFIDLYIRKHVIRAIYKCLIVYLLVWFWLNKVVCNYQMQSNFNFFNLNTLYYWVIALF